MKLLIFLIITISPFAQALANTFLVGSTRTHTSPNQLYIANVVNDGDTILIDPETFNGTSSLAVWSQNNLYIKGVGPGKPHLKANGQQIAGKGIWVIQGNNTTIENIEFSEAAVPDMNGAGIRFEGENITITNCYFHDNENGILTNNTYNGKLTIEHCEFGFNGYGDGYTHNLYVGHTDSLIFQYNYSHHCNVGHTIKSRADYNYVAYNRFSDETTGNSSRLIDIPNGGLSFVIGNILMQGPSALNNNMLGYGLEGLSNTAPHELYSINNTFVNKRTASCKFIDIKSGTTIANVSNNIFAGTGTVITGSTTSYLTNYVNTDISQLNFGNELAYDYHLTGNSPVIDSGTALGLAHGVSLTPTKEYAHPTNYNTKNIQGTIDIGAYEFKNSTLVQAGTNDEELLIYPNPSNGIFNIKSLTNFSNYQVYDITGKLTLKGNITNSQINITELNKNSYQLILIGKTKTATLRLVKD